MYRLLEVSKSGYYKRLRVVPSRRMQRREKLAAQIKEIHEREHRISGQRKYVNRYVETEKNAAWGWFGESAESTGTTAESSNEGVLGL